MTAGATAGCCKAQGRVAGPCGTAPARRCSLPALVLAAGLPAMPQSSPASPPCCPIPLASLFSCCALPNVLPRLLMPSPPLLLCLPCPSVPLPSAPPCNLLPSCSRQGMLQAPVMQGEVAARQGTHCAIVACAGATLCSVCAGLPLDRVGWVAGAWSRSIWQLCSLHRAVALLGVSALIAGSVVCGSGL